MSPDLKILAEVVLVIPVSSVTTESGFNFHHTQAGVQLNLLSFEKLQGKNRLCLDFFLTLSVKTTRNCT